VDEEIEVFIWWMSDGMWWAKRKFGYWSGKGNKDKILVSLNHTLYRLSYSILDRSSGKCPISIGVYIDRGSLG
jgi:hypothetical protein